MVGGKHPPRRPGIRFSGPSSPRADQAGTRWELRVGGSHILKELQGLEELQADWSPPSTARPGSKRRSPGPGVVRDPGSIRCRRPAILARYQAVGRYPRVGESADALTQRKVAGRRVHPPRPGGGLGTESWPIGGRKTPAAPSWNAPSPRTHAGSPLQRPDAGTGSSAP